MKSTITYKPHLTDHRQRQTFHCQHLQLRDDIVHQVGHQTGSPSPTRKTPDQADEGPNYTPSRSCRRKRTANSRASLSCGRKCISAFARSKPHVSIPVAASYTREAGCQRLLQMALLCHRTALNGCHEATQNVMPTRRALNRKSLACAIGDMQN